MNPSVAAALSTLATPPQAPGSPLRDAIAALTRAPEPELLPGLVAQARLTDPQADAAQALALRIARGVRERAVGGLGSGLGSGLTLNRSGLVQGLLQEFALSSAEGVALMCLAEALLRIPDVATRDALIRDKIGDGDWHTHLGRSPSVFVNAAAWGLLITGKLVATHSDTGLSATLRRLLSRGGEPLIRKGVDMAMRMMGEQFVTGQTIAQALTNAREREALGFRFSYDMLGEAAMTDADAQRYLGAYEAAIHAIGAAAAGRGVIQGPGISIKLSALHPRYARAKFGRVMAELYPRLLHLAALARHYDIGLNIDAEESERLELSLDLLERLCFEPGLAGWQGMGFVIQAYQKRCPAVVDWLIDLGRRSRHRLMVRLVKGAYWDSEIKRAQVDGQAGYPVYTRKAYTDVAFIACARKLLAAPDAVFPQFATHNAQTLAAVHTLAGPDWHGGQYEFQCLHGMGEPLYEQVVGGAQVAGVGGAQGVVVGDAQDARVDAMAAANAPLPPRSARPCRIYAPVGTHETLLAYLVRRLLENGANASFVNRIADEDVPLEVLIEDPVRTVQAMAAGEGVLGAPHAAIALPCELFAGAGQGAGRRNSCGLDLADEGSLAAIELAIAEAASALWQAGPMLAVDRAGGPNNGLSGSAIGSPGIDPLSSPAQPCHNPADAADLLGHVSFATLADVQAAVAAAALAAPGWAGTPPAQRATVLEAAADGLEADTLQFIPLLVREAGKTRANAVAELREAVDFLRYYAGQVRRDFDNATHLPLGAVVCISPWNFPLAIFTGQVAAALAAGNVVLAKPAETTTLVAAAAVRALHAAGVPRGALQLLPGPGATVGAALAADARVHGVLFTGSTEVARLLQASLAGRMSLPGSPKGEYRSAKHGGCLMSAQGQPPPLIAETGGQNVLVVDSSALLEQAVADIVASAFDSAGQRCSALRLLCVQDDVADRLIEMLQGAMQELQLGDPRWLATDIGPVIDARARDTIERHVQAMRDKGRWVWRAAPGLAAVAQPLPLGSVTQSQPAGSPSLPSMPLASPVPSGHFVAPTLIALERVDELGREVFGPVLHLLRYAREQLPALLQQINATGYGLTQGVHSRIDETVAQVLAASTAGNVYVNRNIVGAVVGVQPFGGEGLSGTGPKAGGPLYLLRLLAQRPGQAARLAVARSGGGGGGGGGASSARAVLRGLAAGAQAPSEAVPSLRAWAQSRGLGELAAQCDQDVANAPVCDWLGLAGPTGEANLYAVLPRHSVLCLAQAAGSDRPDEAALLSQLSAVLAVGSQALWPASARSLRDRLPIEVREHISLAQDWQSPNTHFDAVLHHGSPAALRAAAAALAQRPGAIVGIHTASPADGHWPLERLVIERSLSINTAAAGGNASLMTLV